MALVCYHGENPHIINQERADIILNAISDPERRKIIASIKNEFKKVSQISEETHLSTSTTYRKIHELNEKNLLISSSKISANGKREFTYKSKIQKVIMTFEYDALDVRIYTNLRD
ncbi:ArsR family transcriptional regulator [Nitrosopumilus sp.]|uniref:ArsR family transcriptional regulator n=1 Tax=Nitrosopumilus sp. TaxID=2024843 RepID=UPI00292D7B89|nr:ArsR family transcriptional regulator [Nitrosopumilus sp.]